jgi:hypothetical protein
VATERDIMPEPMPIVAGDGARAEAPVPTHPAGESEGAAGGKVKAAVLLTGALAMANKMRREAPKKLQAIREKRVAGRCVILTEVAGREVAVGPFPDEQAARQYTVNAAGAPRVIELTSQTSFEGSKGADGTTLP